MDFNFKISDTIWSTITAIASALIARTPIVRKILVKVMDLLAKPIYDWLLRKGYIQIKKVEAKKAETNLKESKTLEEAKKAVDEIP